MATPLQHQIHPIPIDLNRDLPNPAFPWSISENVFGRMKAQGTTPYKKVQIFPTDPEWRLVWRLFHHDKPYRYGIGRIYCVHERHQEQAFELNLSSIEREAATFSPTWNLEPLAAERAIAIDRWKEVTQIFFPFQTMESDGRNRTWTQTKVLPLWHGSNKTVCDSICTSGFTFFGKISIGPTGGPKSTDEGFFGSGIYFTNSARYAADIYGQGHLIFAWVSMREPFPVVGNPEQTDMTVLKGKGAYKDYNAHYVPVSSVDPSNPYEAIYCPTQKGQDTHCDEIVVFHKSQALPRFWVELTVETPYLMSPTDIPQFVNELIPHLLKLLQNPYVDRDQKLRNYLGQELGFLLKLQEDDYLEERHETFYQQLTQLIDSQGKVDRQVSRVLTGAQRTAPTHASSFPQPTPPPAPAAQPLAVPKPAPAPTAPLPPPIIAPVVPSTASLPCKVFGKKEWEIYFGDIGVEPPLPSDIEDILYSYCPLFRKPIRKAFLLVLVPTTVDGNPLTLKALVELIQKPKRRNAMKPPDLWYPQEYENVQASQNYWILFSKEILSENTHGDSRLIYAAHQRIQKQITSTRYTIPHLIEAAIAICTHYIKEGERLCLSPGVRCQEFSDGIPLPQRGISQTGTMMVGLADFGRKGDLSVMYDHDNSQPLYGVIRRV